MSGDRARLVGAAVIAVGCGIAVGGWHGLVLAITLIIGANLYAWDHL